ncbi:MAG: hypothetical protein ACR2FY_08220 [Pirellulaceae bacterium]
MDPSDLLGFLCGFGCVMAVVTVVGHCIWVVLAFIFRQMSGDVPAGAPGKPCPYCRHPKGVIAGRCIACGRVPQVNPGAALEQDLEATARHLKRLYDRKILPQQQFEDLMLVINSDLARLRGQLGPVAPASSPAQPVRPQAERGVSFSQPPVIAEIVDAEAADGINWVERPKPPLQTSATAKPAPFPSRQPAAPAFTHPLDKPTVVAAPPKPPKPARPWADVLQGFMEESNVRWGEIIAGLLIVGSAVGLIFSLRVPLQDIPYSPAILFMLFTLGFYGAGMYTLRYWKLHAISRVILIISLMLVPLSFAAAIVMAGPADKQREMTDPLFIAAVVLGTVVYSWITVTTSGVLLSEGRWRLTIAIIGASLSQIVMNRAGPFAVTLRDISLLAAIPVAGFLVAVLGQVFRARAWQRLSEQRANETFLILGLAAFSLAAPLSLLLHHSLDKMVTLARLTPALSVVAAGVLALGLVVHRRALARTLSAHRTAGTAIALCGGLAMLAMVAIAWPEPQLLLAVGIVNLVLLALLAVVGYLPLLHGAAIACGTLACQVGFHWTQGRITDGATSLELIQAAFMGRSGILFTLLAIVAGGAGTLFVTKQRREDGLVYFGGAAALCGLSILVALVCGLAPLGAWGEVNLDADLAAPLLLFYAAVCLAASHLVRVPSPFQAVPALVGSALLWIGLAQGLALNESLRSSLAGIHPSFVPAHPILLATLVHAVINVLIAMLTAPRLLFAPVEVHREHDRLPLWDAVIQPLALFGVGTLLCCTPFILWPHQEQLALYAGYAGVAAAVWLGALLLLRQPIVMYGVPSMLALCAGYIAANVMFHQLPSEFWYLKVSHLHMQMLLAAVGGVAFALLRRMTSQNDTIRGLLVNPFPAVDQLLLTVVVRMVPGLAIFAAWHGVWFELGVFQAPPEGPLTSQMPIAGGLAGWIVMAVVFLALVVSLWERVTLPALMGIAVTLFAIPWLVATWWAEEYAVASAARWLTAIYGLCGASFFIFRTPLHDLAQRIPGLSWGKLRRTAYYCTAWQPLVFSGLSILTMTIAAVVQQTSGVKLGGPLQESLFDWMGPTISYAVPLYALVAILLGYCVRERQPLFALGGSAVSQFAVNLAFMLRVALGTKVESPVYAIEWLQWNTVAAGGFGLLWLAIRRWVVSAAAKPSEPEIVSFALTSKILTNIQLVVAVAAAMSLVLWTAGVIFLNPSAGSKELAALGSSLSYVAIGLTASIALLDAYRHAARQAANIWPFATLAVISLVAATCDQLDIGRQWLSYHILMAGSLSVAALATTASALEKHPSLSRLVPSHWASFGIAMLVAVMAIRGGVDNDPQEPWWSVGAMAGVCLILVTQGIIRRRQFYAYASLLAAPLAVILLWNSWSYLLVVEACVLAASSLCAIWLSLEIQFQRRTDQPFDPKAFGPPAHHVGIVACVLVLALRLCFATFVDSVAPIPHPPGRFYWLNVWTFAALLGLVAVVARSLWDRRAFFALPTAFSLGLLCIVAGLWHANFALLELALAASISAAGYISITGQIWSYGANLADLGSRWGISDTIGGLQRTSHWLPAILIGITAPVCLMGLAAVLGHEQLEWRVAIGLAPGIAAWGICCLAQKKRQEPAQIGALLLAGLTLVYLGWAQLEPQWTESLLLERVFRLLMALSVLTLLYGLVLPRYLFISGSWNSSARKSGYSSGVLAIVTFVAVLGLEVAMFKPGIGAPVADLQVAAVAVVLVALIAGLLSLALLPGRDPLALDEKGRMFYVYGAQAVSGLLFAHLYVCRPMWFDTVLRPYWPFIIIGLAFAGVAAAEIFQRQKIRVLAEPFRRTGGLLPLIPALAMLIVPAPSAPYELVLFLAGLMYLLLCMMHRSFLYGAAAAVAGNAALWVLLEHQGFHFTDHPQFWLIPPAVAVLLAAQLNRTRLSTEQLTATRYFAVIVIYLSSTSEIFIHSANHLWPPMILAALSVAGALAGIMLRIRAFLYLGASFTLMAMISMVWHAARVFEQTWPWWAFGFGMGIALLVLFALFEKKKEEVKLLIARMRSWEQ